MTDLLFSSSTCKITASGVDRFGFSDHDLIWCDLYTHKPPKSPPITIFERKLNENFLNEIEHEINRINWENELAPFSTTSSKWDTFFSVFLSIIDKITLPKTIRLRGKHKR